MKEHFSDSFEFGAAFDFGWVAGENQNAFHLLELCIWESNFCCGA